MAINRKRDWLSILVPVQFLLLTSQLVTAFNHDRIPDRTFMFIHVYGGMLLAAVVFVYVGLNWSWVRKRYFTRRSGQPKSG